MIEYDENANENKRAITALTIKIEALEIQNS